MAGSQEDDNDGHDEAGAGQVVEEGLSSAAECVHLCHKNRVHEGL